MATLAERWEAEIGRLKNVNEGLVTAMMVIAARRADLSAASKNDYDAGYKLGTEMCCDIADAALGSMDA